MADFTNYKKTTFQDIADYVKAEKPEYLATLTKSVEAGDSFLDIKYAFFKKYFPENLPEPKPQRLTMKQILGLEDDKADKKKKSKKK